MTAFPGPAFLGVAASATGRRWIGPDPALMRRAEGLAQAAGLALPVALVLARRGVDAAGAAAHLAPSLRDLLPDPMRLRDMGAAADRFLQAVTQGQRIAVFADYDVDGAASAALVVTWLRGLGLPATVYVPDRLAEGYGPNAAAMQTLGAAHDLILCLDCGTLGHEALAAAGCDAIVLDHHQGGATLPPAVAVVNPNRRDEPGDLGHLCAAGVVFLFLVEANRRLRARGLAGPDLMALLDLVALATVADVAPLRGVNRAFVRQGLAVMAARTRPGLAALADAAGLAGPPTVHALGHVLGPRVNAGGRIGQAGLGARLLATADPAEAARIAADLDRLNGARRAIEAAVRAAALAEADARGTAGPLAWAAGEGWHPGVIGIVAARLREATDRPAMVIAIEGGEGKGSGRSVAGVDLGAAVARLADEGLIRRGGGHPMAAGLTVARDRIEPAMARLGALLAGMGASAPPPGALALDGLVAAEGATPALVAALEAAGPYGADAPAPRLALPGLVVAGARIVGSGHLRVTFGAGAGRIEGIAFGAAGTPLGTLLSGGGAGAVHVAGRLEMNDWQGTRRVQLRIDDAAPAR